MLSVAELSASVYGAWRLAQRDPGGMNAFDISIGGFWRSFWAAAVCLPLYLLLVILHMREEPYAMATGHVLAIRTLAYGCAWIAFPLAAIPLTRMIDRSGYYIPLIIALNWAAVIQTVVITAAILLSLALPDGLAGFVVLTGYGVILYYAYFVTRTALDIGVALAIAFVLIGVLLEILIYSFFNGLLSPAAA